MGILLVSNAAPNLSLCWHDTTLRDIRKASSGSRLPLPHFVLILAYYFHSRNMISRTTSQHDRSLDLAIIGGGLAGLTLSIGLSKFGIKHTIYESASRFSDIGAGISTGKNAIAALALIDPRIIECYDRCAVPTPSEQTGLPHMSFRWGMARKHRDGLE
jgi:hypothetical protein